MGRGRLLAIATVLVASTAVALANGRFPATSTITFRQGSSQDVVAGATFGALTSHDGGATWHWMCEQAVGYGGVYDPDFAYSSSGAIFATTFNGLRVMRDGCTFAATPLGATFVSQDELAPNGALHVAAAEVADAKIYKSGDDGVSFPTSANPGLAGDWWTSIAAAPSDAQRLYLAGYRFENNAKTQLLFTSANGGTSFSSMTTAGMMLSTNSFVTIVGVAPATPTTVYARVSFDNGPTAEGIYKSIDAGASWTRIAGGSPPLSFLARANGELVVAEPTLAQVSTNGGTMWTSLASPPKITCLVERSNGEVWACTSNYGGDGYGIMKSADLATWTGVLRYEDIAGPVSCPTGTLQHDTCAPQFCLLRMQLSITADPGCGPDAPVDAAVPDAPLDPADAPADAPPMPPAKPAGCCTAGGTDSLALALAMLVLLRRRPSSSTETWRRRTPHR